jgi:FKBP-type peptidyl-prolyl cis-trans isomerase FklB
MKFQLSLSLLLVGQVTAGTNELGLKYLKERALEPGVIKMPSGWLYKVHRHGEGKFHPTEDSECEMWYIGTTPRLTPKAHETANDTEAVKTEWKHFNSAYHNGKTLAFQPAHMPLFKEAMQMMVEGDHWEIYMPSEIGYGDRGQDPYVEGGACLIWRLELEKILGEKVPVDECDVVSKKDCDEEQADYIDKMAAGTAETRSAEYKRLYAMTGQDMKSKKKHWLLARLKLLKKMQDSEQNEL